MRKALEKIVSTPLLFKKGQSCLFANVQKGRLYKAFLQLRNYPHTIQHVSRLETIVQLK
jgi:hypothetical protein